MIQANDISPGLHKPRRNPEDFWQTPGARKDEEGFSPAGLRSMAPRTP